MIDGSDKYIMCTKHPNWQTKPIKIGDKGFLKVKEINAGVDTWYNDALDKKVAYKYDGIQFFDFILEKQKETDEIILV